MLTIVATIVALLLLVPAVDVGYGMTDPLVNGSSSSGLWVCDPATESPDCARTPGEVLYPGARFQYYRTIRNQGAAPITILGLKLPDYSAVEWLPTATIRDDHRYVMDADNLVELTPRTLAPGDELTLVIRGRISECAPPMPEGGNMIFDILDVRYRLLAVEHTESVQTDRPVLVPFNPCPDIE
ncbi:MAG: hypothetical protein LH650_14855 [Chloroflexi bacterium]|nr:hypothetical protein [Chloroflexota bacterium]